MEDPVDGCPGGDQVSRIATELVPYYRRSDGNGGRIPNQLLDRCEDPVVIAGVHYYEMHEDLCRAYRLQQEDAERRAREEAR